jgi:hypothetical protein
MNRATAILRPAQPRPRYFDTVKGGVGVARRRHGWRSVECSTTVRPYFRTIVVSPSPISKQRDGGYSVWALCWAISVFASFYQSQMAKLFQSASPMEFGIGYRWRKNESNLLLAQKESPPGSDEELTPLSQAEGNAAGTAAGAVDTVQHHELSLLNRRMHQPALK